jgi:hypothetical protein
MARGFGLHRRRFGGLITVGAGLDSERVPFGLSACSWLFCLLDEVSSVHVANSVFILWNFSFFILIHRKFVSLPTSCCVKRVKKCS